MVQAAAVAKINNKLTPAQETQDHKTTPSFVHVPPMSVSLDMVVETHASQVYQSGHGDSARASRER